MKTTVEIDDALLKAAKKLAIDEGTTLRALIEDALRGRMGMEAGTSTDVVAFFEWAASKMDSAALTGEEGPGQSSAYDEYLAEKERAADETVADWARRHA